MSKQNKLKRKGTIQACGVAFHQGFEGVLFTLILVFVVTMPIGSDKAAFSAAGLGVKELLALVLVSCWTLYKHGSKFFSDLFKKYKTRQGMAFIIASVFGTSMGNLFYFLGIIFAGAGYGVILTALYPVFSMILVKYVMKEKEPRLVWIGVVIAVIGGFLTILLPVLVNGENFSTLKIVGMFFGLLAAFFWAIEGLFINLGLKGQTKGSKGFSRHEIILTRNIFATLTTFIVIMPILMTSGNTFKYFADLFLNWKTFLIVFAIAVNIIILRYYHVAAIKNVGPKVTAIIDTNNFIVPALVAQVFVFIKPLSDTFANSTIDWWAYFLLIPIIIGVSMVVYFHEEENEKQPFDSVNWEPMEKKPKE